MNAVYEINAPHVISEAFGQETVIINLETGTYHNLNNAGSLIWPFLQHPITLDVILQAITLSKEAPAATLTQSLADFMEHLLAQGLIRESAQPANTHSPAPIVLADTHFVCESYADMQDLLGLDPIHEADANVGWPHKPPI
jgi:hypothetical protein